MIATDCLFGLAEPLPTAGQHSGFVKIPHSSDVSAYGFIPVPIAIVAGLPGPTVLLLAGTFGDEIDSQIASATVLRALDPAAMAGRVIALTMANAPAAQAGTRTSPIDGRTLSRSFPGDVFGTPTSIIADYIERHLMAASDIVIDLHSDGRSLRYLPSVTMIHHADSEVRQRRMAVALAFGAPNLIMFNSFEDRNTSGAARRAGSVRIGTEIGGPDPVRMTVDGVLRVLRWAGIIDSAPPVEAPSRRLIVRQDLEFVYALKDGLFEPACRLGDEVSAGDVAGAIHDVIRPFAPPVPVLFPTAGTVVCTRGAGRAATGDCLMHLGAPPDQEISAEFAAVEQLVWLPGQSSRSARSRAPRRKRSRPA